MKLHTQALQFCLQVMTFTFLRVEYLGRVQGLVLAPVIFTSNHAALTSHHDISVVDIIVVSHEAKPRLNHTQSQGLFMDDVVLKQARHLQTLRAQTTAFSSMICLLKNSWS